MWFHSAWSLVRDVCWFLRAETKQIISNAKLGCRTGNDFNLVVNNTISKMKSYNVEQQNTLFFILPNTHGGVVLTA